MEGSSKANSQIYTVPGAISTRELCSAHGTQQVWCWVLSGQFRATAESKGQFQITTLKVPGGLLGDTP